MLQSSMKIVSETSYTDHQSGCGANCGPDREERTNEFPSAEGGPEDYASSVCKMKEPKKENILELVDNSKVARNPPLILNIAVID